MLPCMYVLGFRSFMLRGFPITYIQGGGKMCSPYYLTIATFNALFFERFFL